MKSLVIIIYLFMPILALGQAHRPIIHVPTQDSAKVKHAFLSLLIRDTVAHHGMSILPISETEFEWLPYLDRELEKYPEGLLEKYVVKIFLVGWITTAEKDKEFLGEGYGALGTYALTDSANYVYLVPYKGVRSTLHHELNSLLTKAKMENDEGFKKQVGQYMGYFNSVSNYKDEGWQEPLLSHEIFLGPNHYAQVDPENDMNVIAQYLFMPLKYFSHNGKDYMLWDFIDEIETKGYPIFSKFANTLHLYELIDPRFSYDHFIELQYIHTDEIPLEYGYQH